MSDTHKSRIDDVTSTLRLQGRIAADEVALVEGNVVIARHITTGNRRIVCDVSEVPSLSRQLLLG